MDKPLDDNPLSLDEIMDKAGSYSSQKDYQQAMHWYLKAVDLYSSTEAMFNVGCMYYYELFGMKKNFPQAIQWFKKAAKQGNAEAMFILGGMHYWGVWGTLDYPKEFRLYLGFLWYLEAAEQGHAEAMLMLSSLDSQQDLQWIKKAVEQDNARAMAVLGMMYTEGRMVEQDHQ